MGKLSYIAQLLLWYTIGAHVLPYNEGSSVGNLTWSGNNTSLERYPSPRLLSSTRWEKDKDQWWHSEDALFRGHLHAIWPSTSTSAPSVPSFLAGNDSVAEKLDPTQKVVKKRNVRKEEEVIMETKSGLIRGVSKQVFNHTVSAFLGIPFAKPPVGALRFKKPVPIDPWPGILDAAAMPNSCYQERYEYFPGFRGEEMWNPNTNISEDCLYLNIWVPTSVANFNSPPVDPKGKPVLIWIYGGGFMSGTSTLDVYDAKIMAAENDVIVASLQYRVGAFGFLYLGTEDAPGNMGLYDQALAIKWIKDNIATFGGDPESMTLFGESAGAGAVSVHFLSPISRHLVRRGILQSGTVNAPWGYMTAETAKGIAGVLIEDAGCNSSLAESSPTEAIACMREVEARNISLLQWNSYGGILGFPSAPTVDGVFLPRHPLEMLKEGDFSRNEILIGSNQDEGTYFILYDFLQYFKKDNPSFLEREKFLEIINTIFKNWSQLEREAIVFQYTDWEHVDDGYLNQKMIGDVVGDYYFVCPANYLAQKFAEHQTNVYYYFFTQRSSTNPWGKWMGVMHADEVEYVFGHPTNESKGYKETERELSRRIMHYYSTFARTGKPVPEGTNWPIYSRNEPQYFIFNGDIQGTGHGPRATSCAFWNEFMPLLRERQSGGGRCGRDKPINGGTVAYSHPVKIGFCFLVWFPSLILVMHRD